MLKESLLCAFLVFSFAWIGLSSLSTEEYKTKYLTVVEELHEATQNRDASEKELKEYILDKSWRQGRDKKLFDYLFVGPAWTELQNQIDTTCDSLFQNRDVLKKLDITVEQLKGTLKLVDPRYVLATRGADKAEESVFNNVCKKIGLDMTFVIFETKYGICAMAKGTRDLPSDTVTVNDFIGSLQKQYDQEKENRKNATQGRLEVNFPLYKPKDKVTIRLKRGKTITAYYSGKAPGGVMLSNGTKVSFSEMDEESYAHFDAKAREAYLRKQTTIQDHSVESEYPFEYYAAERLLDNGYLPDYRQAKYFSTNGKYEPISMHTWMTAREFVANVEAEFLPAHILKFLVKEEGLRYDPELQEYAYPKLWDLRKTLEHYTSLKESKTNERDLLKPLYKVILDADTGNPEALLAIYNEYLSGEFLGKDNTRALEFLGKAADTGYTPAQYALAENYRQGTLCPKDIDQAIAVYSTLADQGETKAMLCLADIYVNQSEEHFDTSMSIDMCLNAIKKGDSQGLSFMEQKANEGLVDFTMALATGYRDGSFVSQNNEEALKWFTLASGQGNKEATRILAEAYYYGKMGVKENLYLAKHYYDKLAQAGDLDAVSICEEIQKKIDAHEAALERQRQIEAKNKTSENCQRHVEF